MGTRTCIESRVKLECEKEQQEQLLLSVIPAYIAAEVSFKNHNKQEIKPKIILTTRVLRLNTERVKLSSFFFLSFKL